MLTPFVTMLPTALTRFTADALDSAEPARVNESVLFDVIVDLSTAMF